ARVVNLRTGVVLSARGGALQKMLPAFRIGAGGPLGLGTQYMSWVSIEDVVAAVEQALFDETLKSPGNAVAPTPLTNAELTAPRGRVLERPTFARVPPAALKLLFGEMAEASVLASQRVMPSALTAAGFSFMPPELEPCLKFTLGLP